MLHIVNFSGGMGSFAEAKLCIDEYGAENTHLLFANVLIEDPDTYRFINETIRFLGVTGYNYTELCEGRTPFEVFVDVKHMGNTRVDPCSKHLKRDPLNQWITGNYEPDEIEVHVGIDYSECHRLYDLQSRMAPYVYRSICVENGLIIRKDFSERFGIKRPNLYFWGLGHGNCSGFCIKAGLGHYAKVWFHSPERYMWMEREEEKCYQGIGKRYPFLRKSVKGVKTYITLREFREKYLETGLITADESLEFGGCGCAI